MYNANAFRIRQIHSMAVLTPGELDDFERASEASDLVAECDAKSEDTESYIAEHADGELDICL